MKISASKYFTKNLQFMHSDNW